MTPTRTVMQEWEEFWEAVKPADAPPVQLQEMRRAFFAGFWCMLQTCRAIGEPDISEEEGIAYLERLEAECRLFQAFLARGKA